MSHRLGDIVEALGGDLRGSPDQRVQRIATLGGASELDIAFLSSAQYVHELASTQAGVVILSPQHQAMARPTQSLIVTDQPYLYYAHLTQWWKAQSLAQCDKDEPRIHPLASIHPSAVVHSSAKIGPFCVIEADVHIAKDAWLKSRVTVSERSQIGERVILHPGVVVGADGFGFARSPKGWVKIEQLGAVRVAQDVEIGANTCIDRGAIDDTVIEQGVKLDNLIQIAHNVHIGAHTAMAACVGVAGSARIGQHCTVGGGAVILGHLSVADHVNISAASVVTKSIHKAGHYSGFFPIDDNASWEKNAVTLKQLHRLRERVRLLEKSLENSEKQSQ